MRISDWSSDVCSSDLSRRNSPREFCAKANAFRAQEVMMGTPRPVPSSLLPVDVPNVWLILPATDCTTKVSTSKSFLAPGAAVRQAATPIGPEVLPPPKPNVTWRSEEHTSELQSLMRISYAVF